MFLFFTFIFHFSLDWVASNYFKNKFLFPYSLCRGILNMLNRLTLSRIADQDQFEQFKKSFCGQFKRELKTPVFHFADTLPSTMYDPRNTYFSLMKNQHQILGCACCEVRGPGKNVGDISGLFESIEEGKSTDIEGSVVTKDDLGNYEGYKDYTGQGPLLYLKWIESFSPRNGHGSIFLPLLQQEDFELIELEVVDLNLIHYYIAHG